MAKRVPKEERKFNALDKTLIQSVVNGVQQPASSVPAAPAVPEQQGGQVGRELSRPADLPPLQSFAANGQSDQALSTGTTAVAQSAAVGEAPPRRDREKRVLLTRSEERAVERVVARLADELGTPVKLSHFLRASVAMLVHAEEELVERSRRVQLVRPGNGDKRGLESFEQGVAELLSLAYREARPLR